jgi:hypothetical protein
MRGRTMWAWAVVGGGLVATAEAAPLQIAQSGRVLDAGGAPVSGARSLKVELFAGATGSSLWNDTFNVDLQDGYYAVTLGSGVALELADFTGVTPWVEVSVGGAPVGPRAPLSSVPYALEAASVAGITDLEARLEALESNPPATSDEPVTFSTPGTQNWIVPSGVYRVRVEAWGGGGSGGASVDPASGGYAAGGGGGGGYCQAIVDVTPGAVIPVTVGAGAATAANTTPGTAGGDSRFGTLVVAKGGRGGGRGPAGTAGNAGGPGGFGCTASGAAGSSAGGTTNVGGQGGTAGGPSGGTGGAGGVASSSGTAGTAPGGGGGGAAWVGPTTGGAGAAGRVVVDPIPTPTPAEIAPVVFTSGGSFDWTVPSGVTSVTVHLWGGGGGGGGSMDAVWSGHAAGGGGGGGYSTATVSVVPGAVIPITVGSGGLGGLPGSGGAAGGTTWFGSSHSAGGGGGAAAGSGVVGNPGGAAGVGATTNGVGGNSSHSGGQDVGGTGGKAGGTAGGLGGTGGTANSGANGASPGGGGGGAAWAGTSEGGAGADGRVLIVF